MTADIVRHSALPLRGGQQNLEVIMKRIFAAAVLAITAMSSAASAADIGGYDRVPARVTAYNWQGFYLGGNLGYQWGKVTNSSINPSGFMGGLQMGYNWQTGQLVYGLETDMQFSGADDAAPPVKFTNPWLGTLRGRGGFAMNNVFVYGTFGLAYGGLRAETTVGGTESKSLGGWTAGVGMEIGLTPAWSVKGEYLYVDLAGRGYVITGASNGLETSILRFGANYRF
jgi:outer membrane immunogenic protein